MSEFTVRLTGDYATNAAALHEALEEVIEGTEDPAKEGHIEVATHSKRMLAQNYITPVVGEMLFNAHVADTGHPEEVRPDSFLQAVRFAFPTEVLGTRELAEKVRDLSHERAGELMAELDAEVDEEGLISDGSGKSYNVEDMDEERLERLANSPLVELILACEDVVGTAKLIQDNEYMWDRLVRDVARSCNSISSEQTAAEVIKECINQMERYGSLGKRPEPAEDEDGDEDE